MRVDKNFLIVDDSGRSGHLTGIDKDLCEDISLIELVCDCYNMECTPLFDQLWKIMFVNDGLESVDELYKNQNEMWENNNKVFHKILKDYDEKIRLLAVKYDVNRFDIFNTLEIEWNTGEIDDFKTYKKYLRNEKYIWVGNSVRCCYFMDGDYILEGESPSSPAEVV